MGIIKGFKPGDKGRVNFSTIDGAVEFDALTFSSNVTFNEGINIVAGTTTGTKIGTSATQKLGFYNATPIVRPSHIANITTTATSGSLPTANNAVTIADATTPTVAELLEYCVELETKVEAILTALRNLGLVASS
jgi:hypothetical protein